MKMADRSPKRLTGRATRHGPRVKASQDNLQEQGELGKSKMATTSMKIIHHEDGICEDSLAEHRGTEPDVQTQKK